MRTAARHHFDAFGKFPIARYLQDARRLGLADVDSQLRAQAAELYCQARRLGHRQHPLAKDARRTLEFVERALAPEWDRARRGEVDYPSYTHIAVLQWVLGTDRRTPPGAVWASCWSSLRTLLDDLLSFEQDALARRIAPRDHFRGDVVGQRVELLRALAERLGLEPTGGESAWVQEPPDRWSAYALEPGGTAALRHWTALPLTREHDEYFLLRTVHLSECCWWGALTALIAALQSGQRRDLDGAAGHLARAVSFAEVLPGVFQVFKKTMPAEHFQSFRLATDKASAIQSRTYQQLQIFLQGLDPKKVAVLAGMPQTADLLGYQRPGFRHLGRLVRQLQREPSPGAAAVLAQAAALDRALYSWRQLHLGKARATLPADAVGTGGVGIEYLESHVRHRLFSPATPEAASGAGPRVKARPVFSLPRVPCCFT
jgi:tryptophan 2,3-dioxygenase